jgi:hypothetical protein|tara:strand:- start:29849 stop:30610 length:762 start_codon:yes stop_codon:yes gene_type:complete
MISKKPIKNLIIFFSAVILLFGNEQIEAQKISNISDIIISEYNMSVLSINQNDQILSIITAVKLENSSEETFKPNFANVAITGMDFLRFSLPKGYKDLYVETDLPEGNLIELDEGFALTSDIPSGNFNLIFNYNVKYKSSYFNFPLHLPHGANSFKIIIPEGAGSISGQKILFLQTVDISSKIFNEYIGKNYLEDEYLNLEINNIPSSFYKKIINSLDYKIINLVIVLIMINAILVFFIVKFFIFRKRQNENN